jgi:hypothetical protein
MAGLTSDACLNCGMPLRGRFCSVCGQRAVPPFPTLREMLVDAWHEFTAFDDRLLRTLGLLLRRPGRLTLEFLAGRRMTYVPPLRLYLLASVAYFLIAAMSPTGTQVRRTATLPGQGNVTIDLLEPSQLTPEERAQALQAIERAPALIRPLLRRSFDDPVGLRQNMLTAMPRMMFVLVPVFAAIVAAFYRRPFSQHLVFALYLHAWIFLALCLVRLVNLTRSTILMALFQLAAGLFVILYSQFSFRNVYGDSWPRVLVKSVGIGVLYLAVGMIGVLAAFTWAALT